MAVLLVALSAFAVMGLGVIIYAVVIYNGLVRLRNNIDKNWSNIDVLLKQRYDELPKLVKVCEGYMRHERQTLTAITEARARLNQGQTEEAQLRTQNEISAAVKSLFVVVESYPELKADKSFRQLQSRISELENEIADRREFFNESVNLYNTAIEQFPDSLIARPYKFNKRLLWKIEPGHRADVEIGFKPSV